ncbi:MAG TPA: hypothetical protein GX740_05705 [Acholeplasmataceae bacterium]|nr:hypothetical protein [Acholeplasmataceae bacterium]
MQEQFDLEKAKNEINIVFSNSYIDEERKRAFVYPKDIDVTPDFKISYLKINSHSKLRHQDILGSILALGLTRDVIGDILVDDQIVLCTSEVENYLINNLERIGRETVEVEKLEELNYEGNSNYLEREIIVSSLRLDVVVARATNLSRSKAQTLIQQRFVKINGKIESNFDYICLFDDIISITKFGRVIIKEVLKKTRKDKLLIKILTTFS